MADFPRFPVPKVPTGHDNYYEQVWVYYAAVALNRAMMDARSAAHCADQLLAFQKERFPRKE